MTHSNHVLTISLQNIYIYIHTQQKPLVIITSLFIFFLSITLLVHFVTCFALPSFLVFVVMEVLSQNFPDRSCAFKGKRTKRSRPSSPLNTAGTMIVTSISSSVAGGSDDDDIGDGGGTGGDFDNSTNIQYSPTTSTNQISTTSTSEEDEDMANCLILLAQSGYGHKVNKKEKIGSRKFAEITTCDNSKNGKAGVYVYECKTCNRTFPSFQALGGHRASHKKPKTIVEEKKTVTINTDSVTATATTTAAAVATAVVSHDSHDLQEQGRLNNITNQTVVNNNNNNNKIKLHECSICGSEFSSGQALGGHMRRHRPPPTTMTTSTTHNNVSDTSSSHREEKSTRNMLSLDLNLPAPPEDDHKYEQNLVFTTPLVDCYY